MKKIRLGSFLVLIFLVLFNACSKKKACVSSKDSITEVGVVINGVKWATRNVNTPGRFASSPEIYGYFYQWNSKVGWPSAGAIGSIAATNGTKTWNSSWTGGYTTPLASDTWTATNDPSPKGWRVPDTTEIASLFNTAKVSYTWTTQNGIYGEKFTDKTSGNSIFLPASGYRSSLDGKLYYAGVCCSYWSRTAYNGYNAYYLDVYGYANWLTNSRATGFFVRPVAE